MSQREAATHLDSSASLDSRVRLWKRWEQGRVRPSAHYIRQLTMLLDLPDSDLRPGTVENVDRRQFLTAATLVGVATLDGADASRGVAAIGRALDGLRDIEETAGPGAALRPAEALCETADVIARSAPLSKRTEAVTRLAELLTYAGHLHTLIDDSATAQRFLDRAVTAAVESSEPVTLSHALGKSSVLALDRGAPSNADSLAAACVRAGGGPHSVATYTYVRAEAAIHSGDPCAARRHLAEAERAAESLGTPSLTMPWSTPTYYAARSASVLNQLGDPAATQLMTDAWAAFPEQWRRSAWARRYFATAYDLS